MFILCFFFNDDMVATTSLAIIYRNQSNNIIKTVKLAKYLNCDRHSSCILQNLWSCCTCCSCVAGYIGERCQFSDLEWWDLQQAEEDKKKNVLIAACVLILASLLCVAACVTYCYRWGNKEKVTCEDQDLKGYITYHLLYPYFFGKQ